MTGRVTEYIDKSIEIISVEGSRGLIASAQVRFDHRKHKDLYRIIRS